MLKLNSDIIEMRFEQNFTTGHSINRDLPMATINLCLLNHTA